MALYLVVVCGSWIATRLPLRAAYALAWVAGTCAYAVSGKARRASESNLAIVTGEPSGSAAVRRLARSAFRNNALNWMDSLRLAAVTREEIVGRVRVEGWELLTHAVEAGNGVIMIGAHLGNIDVVGQIIAASGIQMTIPVEPVKPEALFERTQRLRQRLGIRAIPAENSARQLIRVLRDGGVVGIMADRNLDQDGIRVRFFGSDAIVSKGPAWLATIGGSPVLCGTGTRMADGMFAGLVTEIPVKRTGDREADVKANAQLIVDEVERRIRQHPEQWCMFVPVWRQEDRPAGR